ncbi:MAG: MoxR family ATPase [Bacillota bacterium]
MAAAKDLHTEVRSLIDNINRVMVGQGRSITYLVAALLSESHVLIEDVPGVGKTTLAKSLARSLDCSFQRIQFTPDLVPADITGASVYQQDTGEFAFRPGPLMHQVVLADEINRASPKTQSSLLEAMEERQVTVDGVTHRLPQPFMVLATQNSVEYEGTFPLPEAQLDRFAMRLRLGYPRPREEREILSRLEREHPLNSLRSVTTAAWVLKMQEAVRSVHVAEPVREYLVQLAAATRVHPEVQLGLSPRGTLHLFRLGQALAWLKNRDYVLPDDIKEMAVPACAHRLLLKPQARWEGRQPEDVVEAILQSTPVAGAHPR